MVKRPAEEPAGRRKATGSGGGDPKPPPENATSPPVSIEAGPATATSPTTSTYAPSATASPKDSIMTTPFTPFPSSGSGVLTPNGRTFRRRDVLSVQPPSETPDGFVAKSIIALADWAGGDQKVSDVNDRLLAEGLTEEVGKATTRLNL